MYDLIILGAGPAGITAAIYAARKRLNSLVITKDIGGQAARSAAVKGYRGYQYITGDELVKKFEDHIKEFKIEVKDSEEAVGVKKNNDVIDAKTDKGAYEARSLIIATGARPRTLKLPGENEFKNRGVTYCATCDAPLFVNMDVAVIGGGNSALDATIQLMKIANKIYLINKNSTFRGDEVMREKIEASAKVKIFTNADPLEILGDRLVSGIRIEIGENVETLKVRGVFIEIGSISNSDFVAEPIERNQRGKIVVDNHNRTSVPRIFAAGDVTNVPQKQIVIAAGEGAKAALSANEYLARLKQR
jgi:alkyl hydroperoxide reductase subunit F